MIRERTHERKKICVKSLSEKGSKKKRKEAWF